jgi:hypothetical protein
VQLSDLDEIPGSHCMAMASLNTWGNTSKVRIRGDGCNDCGQSGIKGRYAIAEVIETDEELMRDFVEGSTAIARQNYRARPNAEKSMIERAIAMVLAGQVDPVAVEDNIDVIPPRDKLYPQLRLVQGFEAQNAVIPGTEVDGLLEARA